MDCSRPDSSVYGILQVRILEWVSISSSRGIFPTQGLNPSLHRRVKSLHHWATWGAPLSEWLCARPRAKPTVCSVPFSADGGGQVGWPHSRGVSMRRGGGLGCLEVTQRSLREAESFAWDCAAQEGQNWYSDSALFDSYTAHVVWLEACLSLPYLWAWISSAA